MLSVSILFSALYVMYAHVLCVTQFVVFISLSLSLGYGYQTTPPAYNPNMGGYQQGPPKY
jgi:hypothetical protein